MSRTPCPHCGTTAKHGERVSCCSGCGTLFTSGTAFDRHRRDFKCLAPESVGLVRRITKTDPDAVAWGLPASDHWTRDECPHTCPCTSDMECPHECDCSGAAS